MYVRIWENGGGVIENMRRKMRKGGGMLENRSYDTYILNGWTQTNAVEYFICIYLDKQTRALPPARKMLLFSSIIITIISSYAMIRI